MNRRKTLNDKPRAQTSLMLDPDEFDRLKSLADTLNMSKDALLDAILEYAAYSKDFEPSEFLV